MRYSYVIEPVNFMLLDQHRREAELNKWKSFLMSLKHPVKVVIIKEPQNIDMGGKVFSTEYHRFYIMTNRDIAHNLDAHRFAYGYGDPDLPIPIDVRGRVMRLSDDRYASMLSIYGYPREEAGLITHRIMQKADYIVMYIERLNPRTSRGQLDNFIKMLRAEMMVKVSEGGAPPLETRLIHDSAIETYRAILNGTSAMHLVKMGIGVFANDTSALEARMDALIDVVDGSGLSADRPFGGLQYMIYDKGGCDIYMSTDSLLHLYPFLSANLIEEPGGIPIGLNITNGSPVVYNPNLRSNYNISIIGKSGSGKSMSIKILLGRWLRRSKKSPIFVIDPEGEYRYLGDFGFDIIDVQEGISINMDPVKMLPMGTALKLLRDMMGLNPREASVISVALRKSKDMHQLYNNVRGTIVEDYIKSMIEGPMGWLLSGEEMRLSDRIVFNLRLLDITTRESVSAMILGWVWNKIREYPVDIKKLIVVDEAWLFRGEGAGEIIEHISRLGRKRNILQLIATQRIEDVVLQESHLKVTLQNSSTKFIFRHDASSLEALKALYIPEHLLDKIIADLDPGESLLITDNTMVWVYWYPTEEEYALYTTRPEEVLM